MSQSITNSAAAVINERFPDKFCINLDRRPERWQQMQRKFAQHGIHSVERFAAFDGNDMELPPNWLHTPGAYGCLRSHVQVVREARRLGLSSVLIFEDDVVFDSQLESKFAACIQQLPDDWDMLFFGALHKDEPIKVSENITRITGANSTYACALKSSVFDAFIELNSNTGEVLDNNSLVLQKQFNCYCFMPHLAWVETCHSDAQLRVVDHWYLRESLVLFSPEVDRLLTQTTLIFAHGNRSGSEGMSENLRFLLNYYHKFFSPHIAMVVVEQGPSATVDSAALPANCEYIFLRDDSGFNKERCFAAGFSQANSRRKFVILSDDDIYLETLDFRANLRMCERYDCVTGLSKIIDLTNESSLRLRDTKSTQGLDITNNSSTNNEHPGYFRFFNRPAIQILLDEGESSEGRTPLLSLQPRDHLRVFESPNYALRLQQD
ncbi:MAG TPA: glycosyltransferase family 25 protein [Pyrinomonadaceae bacterium]|jgi:GR25 family glycosyltransferase involved in LPS biosynthesis|nr:glycosyltransferase family 25 protein [Pyrinomonadaceae bacterium]